MGSVDRMDVIARCRALKFENEALAAEIEQATVHYSDMRDDRDRLLADARQLKLEGAVDWLASDEAFEIAYRGARNCGVGKISPAQLTAAMNALADHLRGR